MKAFTNCEDKKMQDERDYVELFISGRVPDRDDIFREWFRSAF